MATPRGVARCAPVSAPVRRWWWRTRERAGTPGTLGPPGACGGECCYYELVQRMTLEERCEVAALFRDDVVSGWVPTAADLLAALDIVRHRAAGPGCEPPS